MWNVQSTASVLTARALPASDLEAAILNAVRAWLKTNPDASALAAQLPALELAFTSHVKQHDAELWAMLQNAMTRLNDTPMSEHGAVENLAARLDLNVRLWQFSQSDVYLDAARRLTKQAIAQFDTDREMFHAAAPDNAPVFCTDANARMAEALYRAWRALDDAVARSIAGTLLGTVSDAFVAGEGLYQCVELPDGARTDTRHIPAYANAIQMFLTATETTGRGTYVSRASILADFIVAQAWASAAQLRFDERALFADALARLNLFVSADAYQNAPDDLLSKTSDVPVTPDAASFVLAIERDRAILQYANH